MEDRQRDERGRHREKRGDKHIKRWYETEKMGNRQREERRQTQRRQEIDGIRQRRWETQREKRGDRHRKEETDGEKRGDRQREERRKADIEKRGDR